MNSANITLIRNSNKILHKKQEENTCNPKILYLSKIKIKYWDEW
jgi:hypothetical protein